MRRIFLSICFLISTYSFADQFTMKQTQKNILQQFANQIISLKDPYSGYITGISMAFQCRNYPVIQTFAGKNGIKDKTPIYENSLFQAGSITKSFVSVVMLQLAKEKHFSLDSHTIIKKYFPRYPKWWGITPRQLMNMTSGIPGTGNARADDIFRALTENEYENYINPNEILDLTYALPMQFKPATQYAYSNTNYTLLGVLIERLTHHSVAYEVKERIFDKLDLKHTYFPKDKLINEFPKIKKSEIVHGYAFYPPDYAPYSFMKFGQDITDFSLSYTNYAGAIVSTPNDINTYLHALYKPGVLLDKKQFNELVTLISEKTGKPFDPSKQPETLGYGLGIIGFYSKELKHTIYLYNGKTNGFNFVYFYNPLNEAYLTFAVNSISPIIGFNNSIKLFYELNKSCFD